MLTLGHGTLAELRFIETPHAVTRVEDWSRVRSPSRARRRMRAGKRQNVVITETPAAYVANGTTFIHPDMAREFRRQVAARADAFLERAFYGALTGNSA